MATMSIGAVRKLHVFLLVTTMAVAVSSALPLSASDELQLEIPDGLTDSDLDQLSQLRRNVRMNIVSCLSPSKSELK